MGYDVWEQMVACLGTQVSDCIIVLSMTACFRHAVGCFNEVTTCITQDHIREMVDECRSMLEEVMYSV